MKLVQVLKAGVLALALVAMAAPTAVHANHPNKDSVKDARGNHVLDARDNCVRTKWDAGHDPCNVIELDPEQLIVYFDFDKDELTVQAREKLDTIAEQLQKADGIAEANVVGYADPIGDLNYNVDLSRRRAQAVVNYLAYRGYINENSTTEIRALGESEAQTRCEGIQGRQALIDCLWKERRVEVEIVYNNE